MRLLHTSEFVFHEFFDSEIPVYAILSHRWGSDEISLQDFSEETKLKGDGYRKIKMCCKLAVSNDYEWVWIDTCCIDKKSSAELSEAINSMYRWYQRADVCYAYLSDVYPSTNGWIPTADSDHHALGLWKGSFHGSSWFTRGWTLQELLAPKKVMFFDHRWNLIGTRADLAWDISLITSISHDIITNPDMMEDCSVAQKMSWAATRSTSRLEDAAYCLLGIFDISMPLLYGEGNKAFTRLQEEIIRMSNDESIFAWGRTVEPVITQDRKVAFRQVYCLLAPSPRSFVDCGRVKYKKFYNQSSYSVTNRGLQMTGPLLVCDETSYHRYLPLNCTEDDASPLALELIATKAYGHGPGGFRFLRTACVDLKEYGFGGKESDALSERQSVEVEILISLQRNSRG